MCTGQIKLALVLLKFQADRFSLNSKELNQSDNLHVNQTEILDSNQENNTQTKNVNLSNENSKNLDKSNQDTTQNGSLDNGTKLDEFPREKYLPWNGFSSEMSDLKEEKNEETLVDSTQNDEKENGGFVIPKKIVKKATKKRGRVAPFSYSKYKQ
eukprot:TRINITY_DN61651_c0_g1_i1.p1 TRINITY_DN61651_c0_g1~~TRINITY_DN61651_c0_g1_i1.p1  ORF type:complete len:162 (+),score=30.36 TRINITY_DN61651_c0_g1_i1:22-486(+)